MHHIAFGGRAPPGPAGGAYSAPQTASWIEGKRKGRGSGKGEDPCLKCVDADEQQLQSAEEEEEEEWPLIGQKSDRALVACIVLNCINNIECLVRC